MTEPWRLLLQRGDDALLAGRFVECDRLATQAARLAPGEPGPGLLAAAVCREQGRAAEAEILVRAVLAAHRTMVDAHALLGAVLADLGHDGEAGRQLDRVDVGTCPPGAALLAAEIAAVLHPAGPTEALHARLVTLGDELVPPSGSAARHLGLLCHVLGRWDAAAAHFEAALLAHQAAGAPVLLAHTRRQFSALLRVRGRDGDWERAVDLLAVAAAVYRRLDIDRLADEADAVLRRSHDAADEAGAAARVNVFRRTAHGWEVSFRSEPVVVADSPGLGHVAALLAAEGRPVHAVDLVVGPTGDGLREQMEAEYRSRLTELDGQLVGSAARPDPVATALARAERDALRVELASIGAGASGGGDTGDQARRLVATRIRIGVDRLEPVLPGLARHLRRSIRTGTFCLYEPERPERGGKWARDGPLPS